MPGAAAGSDSGLGRPWRRPAPQFWILQGMWAPADGTSNSTEAALPGEGRR